MNDLFEQEIGAFHALTNSNLFENLRRSRDICVSPLGVFSVKINSKNSTYT
ncbi:MAG: hypothetical protein AB7V56_03920 [Candidatus Nitrosocosmicus sp.]|jgi:hypothetical protein|uniref:hypothetical protein n=1 Tax=Candidatus Nitrosocosmicus agrestis TaxID=2563600 RepID=UPI0012B5A447|nr:hypothetical protein [Candidatus Nitrosocosmicus sp. SS]